MPAAYQNEAETGDMRAMTRRPANWLSAENQQLTACHVACLERRCPRNCRKHPLAWSRSGLQC